MSVESLIPGSMLYSGPEVTEPPPMTRGSGPEARPRHRRDRWAPIHADGDPASRERRLRAVQRDVALHLSGAPCGECGETARLSGGPGCGCAAAGGDLEKRCLEAAERARAAGDPWRSMTPTVPAAAQGGRR